MAERILVLLHNVEGPQSTRSAAIAAHQLAGVEGFEVPSWEALSDGLRPYPSFAIVRRVLVLHMEEEGEEQENEKEDEREGGKQRVEERVVESSRQPHHERMRMG